MPEQVLHGASTQIDGSGSTSARPAVGHSEAGFTRSGICAPSGTLKRLRVYCNTAPGAGESTTYALQVNEVDTALTVTISGTNTTGSNLASEVAVVAGDRLRMQAVSSAGAPNTAAAWTYRLDTNTRDFSALIGGARGSTLSPVTIPLHAVSASGAGSGVEGIVPVAGTLRNLYIWASSAAGAGQSETFTVQKGGVDTAITCTISGATQTDCSDLSNTVAVAVGDVILLNRTSTAPAAARDYSVGVVLQATTEGQFPMMFSSSWNAPTFGGPFYGFVSNAGTTFPATTESTRDNQSLEFTAQAIYINLSSAPGTGDTKTFTLREAAADTVLSCAISGASAKTCSDVEDEAIAEEAALSMQITFSGGLHSGTTVGYGIRGFRTLPAVPTIRYVVDALPPRGRHEVVAYDDYAVATPS